MYTDVNSFCISPSASLQQAIKKINENSLGIVLAVDEQKRLVGTITDGDIRRAILSNIDLPAAITVLLERKSKTKYAKPFFGVIGQDKQSYLKMLKEHQLSHLPILDKSNRVVGLITSDEFIVDSLASIDAVVMAGGWGTRLLPLTEDLPKPMLSVGKKPLLEIIIEQLSSAGIKQVNVTTHHKPEKIKDHFGDGQNFGVNLSYVSEDRPLGTAGALGLMDVPKETLLVINGDILTQVNFKAMLQFHREHQSDLTVAVRQYDLKVPYGVVECEETVVKCIKEKPVLSFLVNAGIYLLEPNVYSYIPEGEHCDMTDLIETLLSKKRQVVSFPIHEEWLDIGNHTEYQLAQQEIHKYQPQTK